MVFKEQEHEYYIVFFVFFFNIKPLASLILPLG